jgi:hypothetical protein
MLARHPLQKVLSRSSSRVGSPARRTRKYHASAGESQQYFASVNLSRQNLGHLIFLTTNL